MKPDQQSNYWQHDSDEESGPDNQPEMYTPEPVEDELGHSPEKRKKSAEPDDEVPVHWVASEYIHHEKSGLWFLLFALVVIGLIALDLLLLRSYTFSALVIVMAIAVIVYSRRPPRQLNYTLSGEQGLYVGERLYHFSEFKSFGLIKDGPHNSIMLIPTKRFAPGVSVYFPDEAGEQIIDILGSRLPMENLKLDAIDILVRTLRL